LSANIQQVRRIALRDPKVRAAYADADRRLEAKMVQIDPALAPLHPKPRASCYRWAGAREAARERTCSRGEASTQGFAQEQLCGAFGDTLASIARANRVSVASLRAANRIEDERKLRVGQALVIPANSNASPAAAPAKEQSVWDRFGL
jgi:hypothetical protein